MPVTTPKISIVIPVYNGANFLRSAIESALAQTYENFEVIVVNDGSSDHGKTEEIAISYGDRIRYYSKPNGGVASALNAAIREMGGDYFSWLSHDDEYYPDKLERQVDYLSELNDPNNVVLFSDYELIEENGISIRVLRWDHELLLRKPLYALLRGYVHGCSVLVPRRIFSEYRLFNENLRTTQDYDLWFHIIREVPFIHVPVVLVKSRWHPSQDSKTSPKLLEENNDLWKRFTDALSAEEMCHYEGSVPQFYGAMARFLGSTPFVEAKSYAADRMMQALDTVLVSVIIPFYGRVQDTILAIESARNQSHRALDIVIIDDGSTDDLAPIEQLALKDQRCRLLRQSHAGASVARNTGIQASQGEFIAFLDSDDCWIADKIERQLLLMAEQGAAISHTSYWRVVSNGGEEVIHSGRFSGVVYPRIIGGCPIASSSVMVRRDVFDEIRMFDSSIRIGEDVILWIRICESHALLGIDEPMVRINVNDGSTINMPERMAIGVANILQFVMRNQKSSQEHYYICILIMELLISQWRLISRSNAEMIQLAQSNGALMSLVRILAPGDGSIEMMSPGPESASLLLRWKDRARRVVERLAVGVHRMLRKWPALHRVARFFGRRLLRMLRN